ncbi:LacI family DNA-binding transcriptional regulator [Enterococcus sp. 669A]|uniref:LacI family DNA-binding transcriptional regulator n=1 Tax=Candidatus Enterococcus moelleringii TaxID=2815325 RepID=A0ABS3LEG4_9ENTE|nr:LacI family DNA-binding transcriptional regulator [Enterococcus sp. 669A]MBO1308027.1 LacI family DNA-binding transcriptional regulator [Enterococcus sp. 669A]
MATIKEVAKKAGLSVSTVSRYLNKHPYISEDKRRRIQAAMDELHYRPSTVATQLRSKKGKTIGILVSRIVNPFFSQLVDSIEQCAKDKGYNVLIMQTYDDRNAEINMLEMLKQHVIAGLIMCSIEGEPHEIEAYQEFGPIILCNEEIPGSSLPQVYTDQQAASFEAVEYLINKGHKKIAYCTGGTLTTGGHGNSRTEGFEQAINKHGLPMKIDWIFKQVHTIQDGQMVARKMLALPENIRPDAVFTSSDEVAIGIMKEYIQAGKRVPEDLAILGFDNQPFTDVLAVPLTTIAQPVEVLGRESTNLLLAKLEERSYTIDQSHLHLSLIKRESA